MIFDFGTLKFNNEKEYYTALGSFCNRKAFSITYEPNKLTGSYGDAYRLRKLSTAKELINPIKDAIRTNGRINCNKYVNNLIKKHNFLLSGKRIRGNLENVIKTVPEKYVADFIQGYVKSAEIDNKKLIIYQTENIKETAKTLKKITIPKRKNSDIKKTTNKQKLTQTKQDYVKRQIQHIDVGQKGEELIFKLEKEKLLKGVKNGIIPGLEGYLKWVSLDDDSKGYDILSFDLDTLEPLFIEVKTTMDNRFTPFYMTANEVQFSKVHANNYRLYRIFDLKKEVARYYELVGDISISQEVKIDSVNFMVYIK